VASRTAEVPCVFAVQIEPMRERTINRQIARPRVDDEGIRALPVDLALDEYAIVLKREWHRGGLELGRRRCGAHMRPTMGEQHTYDDPGDRLIHPMHFDDQWSGSCANAPAACQRNVTLEGDTLATSTNSTQSPEMT